MNKTQRISRFERRKMETSAHTGKNCSGERKEKQWKHYCHEWHKLPKRSTNNFFVGFVPTRLQEAGL